MRHASARVLRLALVSSLAFGASALGFQSPAAQRLHLGLRGVFFVPNEGQWSDAGVIYGYRSRGLDIAFRESSFTMHLARQISDAAPTTSRGKGSAPPRIDHISGGCSLLYDQLRGDEDSAPAWEHLTLTVTFPGSNEVQPVAAQPRSAKFNYYLGDDASKWASNVPSFGEVIYENLYDGVDLRITGAPDDSGVLKYEFRAAPGVDYSQIRIAYDGIDSLCIDEVGALHIATALGTLTDAAPLAWQGDAAINPIPARFELLNDTTYTITLDGPVDPTQELIIDPEIEWMRFVGGSSGDGANGVCADQDAVYVCGSTLSADFDRRLNEFYGLNDAYIARFTPTGDVEWMTYCGGVETDFATAIASLQNGTVVAGWTKSQQFAGATNTYHGGTSDGFVLRLDAAGELQWMKFLGGEFADWPEDVKCAPTGSIFITGLTESTQWVSRRNGYHGAGDSFVLRLTPAGEEVWMRFVGGSNIDHAYALTLDADSNAYIAGFLASLNLEGAVNSYNGGVYDAFVARVTASGSGSWATYLGGSDIDTGYDVDLMPNGELLAIGSTQSLDFSGRSNAYKGGGNDGFLVRVGAWNGIPRTMLFAGGDGVDVFRRADVAAEGRIFVGGSSSSSDLENARNRQNGAGQDAFVAELDGHGGLSWSFYLGGGGPERGLGIASGPDGAIYAVGQTESARFTGQRNDSHGEEEGFLVRISESSGRMLLFDAPCPDGGLVNIEWSGATHFGTVAILFARTDGSLTIPPGSTCAGTTLGLSADQIRVVFTGDAGPEGARSIVGQASADVCGAYLQLLDLSTCGPSNVARIE